GLSLWLQREGNEANKPARRIAILALAAMTGGVALVSEAEYLLGRDLYIDQWWLGVHAASRLGREAPQLMSSITSLGLLLLAIASLNLRTRRVWPAQFLALAAVVAAIFGALNFVVDPRTTPAYISLPVPSALALTALGLGLVSARADCGLGAILAS